jgi:hypothetical protein
MGMKQIATIAIIAATAIGSPAIGLADDASVPLSKVAADLGYTYSYLGPQNSAELSRYGLVVLIRPGQSRVEINDKVEISRGVPRVVDNDIYVPPSLVSRLRQLATRYPTFAEANPPPAPPAPQPRLQGAIAMTISQIPHSKNLAVRGTAPAGAPITLTLMARVSSDVPDVVVRRDRITVGPEGRFDTVVMTGSADWDQGYLILVATSVSGVEKASAQIVLQPPNGSESVPAETEPNDVR